MALTLSIPITNDLSPRITVIGVGGAGGNAVNNMIENQLEGCEFVVANTDAQALQNSRSANKLQLGARVTEGLGAGAGRCRRASRRQLSGPHMASSLLPAVARQSARRRSSPSRPRDMR